jgi:hypothetical protein
MVMAALVIPEETGRGNGVTLCSCRSKFVGRMDQFLNELEEPRQFANYVKNIGNTTIVRDSMRTWCISLWPRFERGLSQNSKGQASSFSGAFSNSLDESDPYHRWIINSSPTCIAGILVDLNLFIKARGIFISPLQELRGKIPIGYIYYP